jgi:ABC-type Fe3+ transport system substrate-binding protein
MSSRSFSTKILAVLIIVVVVAAVGAYVYLNRPPGPSVSTTSTEKGLVLRVITRDDTSITNLAHDKFMASDIAKKLGITDVLFLEVPADLWRDTISGYKARGQPIDLAMGGGPTLFDELIASGLVSPITRPETLQAVGNVPNTIGGAPLKRFSSDGKIMWVAKAISSFGFIINNQILQQYGLPTPRTWEDLASIQMAKTLPRPAVSYASPSLSTSHTRIYEIILQKFGWDQGWSILARLAANGRAYPGSVEALTAVQSGETPIGIAIDFYGYSSELQFPQTKYVLPFNESIVNGDPVAFLSTSSNSNAAQAFIEWLVSADGQKIWMDPVISRLPVTTDVFKTPEGQARKDLYAAYNRTISNIGIPFSDDLALKYEYAMRIYFDAVFGDLHDDLVSAWSKLASAYNTGKISQANFNRLALELGKPLSWTSGSSTLTFTQEYAVSINESLKNAATASQFTQVWRNAARDRYQSILSQLPP